MNRRIIRIAGFVRVAAVVSSMLWVLDVDAATR
jgi:hypothetical protein